MPDTPIDRAGPEREDPGLELRLSRVEADLHEVKAALGQMVPLLARIDATLTSTLPHLATKAELEAVRSELLGQIAAVRTDLADTRTEFTEALAATRAEFTQELARTREEFAAQLARSREEFATQLVRTREEFARDLARIRSEFSRELEETRSSTATALADLRGELRAALANMPTKTYLWGVLGVLVAAIVASYGAGLAVIALR